MTAWPLLRHRCRAGLAAATLALCAGHAVPQQELPLTAAIVVNLLQFVQWPGESQWPPGAALVLCADRRGALWTHLAPLQSRPVRGGLPLQLRDVVADSPDGLRGCHAWVAEGAAAVRPGQAASVLSSGVLTIAVPQHADEPGMVVRLRLNGDRVGFDIDLGAARRAGLQISSKLLRLAGRVQE